MEVEKLLEITQALEVGIDTFYKNEEVKLNDLKNMPYAVAKEEYVSTKRIIENKDDTYNLIEDLKERLSFVKEIEETRQKNIEITPIQELITNERLNEEIVDFDPDILRAKRKLNDNPRLRRFLLSDSSIERLNRNGGNLTFDKPQDELEDFDAELIENDIENDMNEIMRIKEELSLDRKDFVSETITTGADDDDDEDEYFGFVDATELLETIDKEREEALDFSKTLYINKPNFSTKIRAIGLPDDQLSLLIASKKDNYHALEEINRKCSQKEISQRVSNIHNEISETTDVFTSGFDEAFQKALAVEKKRRVDTTKISEREKALRELSQME